MNRDALVLLAAAGAGLLAYLERYRITSQGANPWTLEGLANVTALTDRFDKACRLVNGKPSSVFRSAEVNAKVGGSPTSDHLAGRAIDIVPAGLSMHDAAALLYAVAMKGELGGVREVLEETGCVHVGWYPLELSPPAPPRLGKWRM